MELTIRALEEKSELNGCFGKSSQVIEVTENSQDADHKRYQNPDRLMRISRVMVSQTFLKPKKTSADIYINEVFISAPAAMLKSLRAYN